MDALTDARALLRNPPLYLKLREQIINEIRAGKWQPGQRLPSKIDLARDFGVSDGSMRQAYDLLEQEGWIVCKQGWGTIVSALPTWEEFSKGAEKLRLAFGAFIWNGAALVDETGFAWDAAALRKLSEEAGAAASWLNRQIAPPEAKVKAKRGNGG